MLPHDYEYQVTTEATDHSAGVRTTICTVCGMNGGEETFAADGDRLVWAADGADISYEGTSEAPLPVGVRFTYVLDGKEIAPEELKGKSGHLEILIDYEAALREDVEIDGEASPVSSCVTEVREGMRVTTKNDKLKQLRKISLREHSLFPR